MELDEKAFQAAWVAWTDSAHTKHYAKLQDAIAAYEQACERVAVPTREEIARGLHEAHETYACGVGPNQQRRPFDEMSERYRDGVMVAADYVLTLLRPAPSAQPWTRDQLIAVYMDAFPTLFSSRYDIEQGGCTSRDIDRIVASLNKLFGPTAPVASAQKSGAEWNGCIESQLRTALASVEEEHALRVAVERDLAAERAAHQATKAGLDEAIARAGRLEAKASQLTDMLHAERAAHEATRAELANAANALPPIVHPLLREIKLGLVGVQSAVDPNDRLNRIGVVRNLVSQAIVLSRGKEQAGQAWDSCIESRLRAAIEAAEKAALERDLNATEARRLIGIRNDLLEAAEERAAELERERDEARAKLEALREAWGRPVDDDALARLKEDGWSAIAERATRLQAVLGSQPGDEKAPLPRPEVAELGVRLAEFDKTLGLLVSFVANCRTKAACSIEEAADQFWEELEATCSSIEPSLSQESAKPASWLREVIDETKARDVPMSDFAEREIAKIRAEPKPGDDRSEHMRVVRETGTGELLLAESPNPGDVLSGEAAKAYMLANPGRRVRAVDDRITYTAFDGGILLRYFGKAEWERSRTFDTMQFGGETYVVLPPEPAKPAIPDLDLAGRVQGLEAAVKAIAEFCRTRSDMYSSDECDAMMSAVEALEGGGSDD